MGAEIPVLTTPRLVLRAQTVEDWPRYLAFMQSDRARFMGGPYDVFGAWALFTGDLAQWPLFGHGGLMIDERATGRCVGQVGINHGPLFPEKELGWMLYEGFEGKGYALEAASALRHWGFTQFGLETLVSYIDPENAASRRLAERLGAVLDSSAPRNAPDDLVYRHPRP
ncbi:GNAT family N-acetyltransferase [Roseibium aestuarii]|uniref:GNAT family N-acetyltransferase n=1 Tax=Roseibium aestuarii TaxID=2600299 RepID=A0ABW4JYY3_9HYPH|nr:GNAT family N-acetyltransferase [Roseibium aestuarii]